MDPRYQKWIAENVQGDGYGQCHKVAQRMAESFPELTYVRGEYYCPFWGPRMHGWCIDIEGRIVDPTALQFPSKGEGHYEQVEDKDLPVGRCMECGELFYDNSPCMPFCSKECAEAYTRALEGEIRG